MEMMTRPNLLIAMSILTPAIGVSIWLLTTLNQASERNRASESPNRLQAPASSQRSGQPSPLDRTAAIPQGWITYKDPQARYEVSYPPNWGHVTLTETLVLGPIAHVAQIEQKVRRGDTEVQIRSGITITSDSPPVDTATDDYKETTKRKVIVSGIAVTEYTVRYRQNIGFAKAGDVDTIAAINYRSNRWMIATSDNDSRMFFDKVLSTFELAAAGL
jgi:hypothetical protein